MATQSWSISQYTSKRWVKQTNLYILLLLLCCGMLIERVENQGLSMIGTKTIRPYSNYTVVICNSLNQITRLGVTLEDQQITHQFSITKWINIQHKSCTIIFYTLGNIPSGDYTLKTESIDRSLSFDQEIELDFEQKSMSVFIQTDKPVYTPGDTIRFRVIAVDANTRPVTTIKSLSILLEDSEITSIRKWPSAPLDNGVFQSEVKLASSPTLGSWTITVDATEHVSATKQIAIKEYVLPKFFVKIKPTHIILVNDKKVSITIEAYYTFNEPVDGNYVAKLFLDPNTSDHSFEKSDRITGKASLEFELEEEVDSDADDQYFDVTVNVVVTEAFSNRTVNITELVPIYWHPYVVTILPSIPSFRPGVPYDLMVVVEDNFGQPPQLEDNKTLIQLNAEFFLPTDSEVKSIAVNLDGKGEGWFTLTPHQDAQELVITATYDSQEYDNIHKQIHVAVSESNQYLRVTLNQKYINNVKVNKDIILDIACTETMTHFFYIVVARGNIVKASSTPVSNKKKYSLRLKMTAEMSPEARVIVYYNNKEYLIFDDIELKFDSFNNEFKFFLNSKEYLPGEEVQIDVHASKDSYVAFSGIDQSMLLMRNSPHDPHDINRDYVLKELALYGATHVNKFDFFQTHGLFLRSTAFADAPVTRSQYARYGRTQIRRRPIKMKERFLESWLWTDFTMDGRKGFARIYDTIPDTITTYHISGFALSPTRGLGVVNQPVSVIVKKKFYLVANLPYSIKRGEVALIQVIIFNFLDNDISTDVTLFGKRDEIELVGKASTNNAYRTKSLICKTYNGNRLSFLVKAKKLGQITVKFVASNAIADDTLEHMLRVIPESHRVENNIARFFELPTFSNKSFDFLLNIPQRIDEGSVEIKFTLDPDILGKAIENLHDLIQKPAGCGEQNMLQVVPNIVVLDYLSETDTVAENVRTKAKDFLSIGYQNQLRFKRSDGAFSIWEKSQHGSTFLTAFVAKSLKIAAKYIDVDKSIIDAAFDWLAKQQTPDGRFPEVGQVFHANLQSGIRSNTFALTAYVLIAFAENKEVSRQHRSVLIRTANYIANNLDNMVDAYELSLATYGLMLAKHDRRRDFLDRLVELSISNKTTSERYWERNPMSVEVTAYAMLSYIADRRFYESMDIMRWLNRQRYGLGAYSGTQDTFIGLKALATFAARSGNKNDYRVTIKYSPNVQHTFDIDKHVPMSTHELDIPNHIKEMKVEIEGTGTGYFQLWYQYFQNIEVAKQRFNIEIYQLNTTSDNIQQLDVCLNYDPVEAYQRSSMALVEIFLPSGFVADADAIEDRTRRIQRFERRFSDSSIVVYYDNMGPEYDCFKVTAYRRYKIALHLPAYIKAYDYYNSDHFGIKQYGGKVLHPCDICEDEDCEILSCRQSSK